MDDILTPIVSVIGSAVISFLVAKYYGERMHACIDNVAYSHSQSKGTALQYRTHLATFCDFIGKTPQQILDEYEKMRDRDFQRNYATYVGALISKQLGKGYAPTSIKTKLQQYVLFSSITTFPWDIFHLLKTKLHTTIEISPKRKFNRF